MEYVIHLLAIFIALGFLLKVGFYPRWGMWTAAAGCALFAWLVTPWMTEQSKTVMAAFFASRPQMLNLSVCVTLEAAVMIAFCFDCFAEMRTRNTAFKQAVTLFLKLYPGILIGGVICYVLALLLFTFPGLDFGSLSWMAAGVTFLAVGVGSRLLRYAIGGKPLRLEILFIVNIFIVILSIIATGY
ncbi:hypothetical protein [uncultured Bacteroides sp.]|uniref:hypothetical protein n=1 Tax=uncultured Bacteroides sp. TaxID=162156 RepID=UPI0025F942AB|nr:hypothetical protein [uncultured Bacteroides sp.]